MQTIEKYGSQILKNISEPINEINEDIRTLAQEMIVTMNDADGIGLAAPQIGQNIRLFTLGVPEPSEKDDLLNLSPAEVQLIPEMPLVFINTEILHSSKETESKEEGCLSIPKLYAPVERPKSIKFKTTLLDGKEIIMDASGLLARAIQHELDHLNGILFVDKTEPEYFVKIKKKLKVLARKNK